MKQKLYTILSLVAICVGFARTASAQYCTTNLYLTACFDGDNIESFGTSGGSTGISNLNTGCGNATTGYTYYSAQTHTGLQGSTVNFFIKNNIDYEEYYKVWVDWNADNDFLDAGEQVYSAWLQMGDSINSSFVIPLTATAGTKRLRVRAVYDPTPFTACSQEDYGEIEDYNLVVTAAAPCSGTPVAGTVVSTSVTACPNVPFTLSANGTTAASGLSFQWQSKPPASSTWTNITGATNTMHTVTNQTTATDYRLVVSCGLNAANSAALSVAQNPFYACYCSPLNGTILVSQQPENDVTNVSIAGTSLNYTTTAVNTAGYLQVPTTASGGTATLTAGTSYTLTAAISSWTAEVGLWIDYNQDGSFAVSEQIPLTINSSVTSATGTFTVPASALNGQTGLRIMASEWNTITGPCQDVAIGEVEDYTITINSATASCTAPTGLSASGITSTGATLSWTAVTGASGYQYLVDQTAGAPATAGTPTTATSYTPSGLSAGTTYYLHVRTYCGGTTYSAWTNFAFTTSSSPCNSPSNITASVITSTTATVNWSAPAGATGYQYVLNTTSTPPGGAGTPVTGTSQSLSSLTPNTAYYFHIRTSCGTTFSGYTTYSFTTSAVTPGCSAPTLINIGTINPTSVTFAWPTVSGAASYEYGITTSAAPPASVTTVTGSTSATKTGLTPSTIYYIYLRTRCNGTTTSGWTVKQFSTVATGVNNLAGSGFALNVYPNPVQDKLTLELNGEPGSKANLTIADLSGRVLSSYQVSGKTQEISMEAMAPGIYLLKYNDDEQSAVIRIQKR